MMHLFVYTLESAATGRILDVRNFPEVGALIHAENGWFVARVVSGDVVTGSIGDIDTGTVEMMRELPHAVFIQASKGLFLAHVVNGAVAIDAATATTRGGVTGSFPGNMMFILAPHGLFLARALNNTVIVDRETRNAGDVEPLRDFPGGGVLVESFRGLLLAHVVNGALAVNHVGVTGSVSALHEFANQGVLVGALHGLFLARVVNGEVVVDPIGKIVTGDVHAMYDFRGGGVLIDAAEGWFLARPVNGEPVVYPLGNPHSSGRVWNLPDGGGALVETPRGCWSSQTRKPPMRIASLHDACAFGTFRT